MPRRCDIDTLKERIADAYDPDDLLTLLHIDVEDLLEAFEDRLHIYREEFADLEDSGEEDYDS